MSRIKSAWEIALEKTEGLEVDEARLHSDSLVLEGKALAGKYLNNMEMSYEELEKSLAKVSPQDMALVKNGLAQVVLSNITLPSDLTFKMRFERLADIARATDSRAGDTMDRLTQFLSGYLDEKENYVKSIEQQLTAAMRDNPDSVDPSKFSQIVQQNLKRLDAQYQGTLDSTKETLKELFGV